MKGSVKYEEENVSCGAYAYSYDDLNQCIRFIICDICRS